MYFHVSVCNRTLICHNNSMLCKTYAWLLPHTVFLTVSWYDKGSCHVGFLFLHAHFVKDYKPEKVKNTCIMLNTDSTSNADWWETDVRTLNPNCSNLFSHICKSESLTQVNDSSLNVHMVSVFPEGRAVCILSISFQIASLVSTQVFAIFAPHSYPSML